LRKSHGIGSWQVRVREPSVSKPLMRYSPADFWGSIASPSIALQSNLSMRKEEKEENLGLGYRFERLGKQDKRTKRQASERIQIMNINRIG
jgi:hypothetical protein